MKKQISKISIAALATLSLSAYASDQKHLASPTQVLLADLTPLNQNFTTTGNQTGTAVVTITGDRIDVVVNGSGVDPSMMHMGHIHKGDHCPDQIRDDTNGDGVLDVIEGVPAYGPILVDFGADISTFAAAQNGGDPEADACGVLTYHGTGDYCSLVDDLHNRPAMPAASGIGKLAPGEAFVPEMGVIVIHGISPSTALPSSVQTVTGLTPQESLPILCGRLHY